MLVGKFNCYTLSLQKMECACVDLQLDSRSHYLNYFLPRTDLFRSTGHIQQNRAIEADNLYRCSHSQGGMLLSFVRGHEKFEAGPFIARLRQGEGGGGDDRVIFTPSTHTRLLKVTMLFQT